MKIIVVVTVVKIISFCFFFQDFKTFKVSRLQHCRISLTMQNQRSNAALDLQHEGITMWLLVRVLLGIPACSKSGHVVGALCCKSWVLNILNVPLPKSVTCNALQICNQNLICNALAPARATLSSSGQGSSKYCQAFDLSSLSQRFSNHWLKLTKPKVVKPLT